LISRPLLCLTLAFAAGIALSGVIDLSPPVYLAASLFMTLTAAVVFFVLRINIMALLTVLFILLGMASGAQVGTYPDHVAELLGKPVSIEGYVCSEPDLRSDKTVYELSVKKVVSSAGVIMPGGRVLVYVKNGLFGLSYGDMVKISGIPYMPERPGNPGQFDYVSYLRARGVWALLSVKDSESIVKTGTGGGGYFAGMALKVKEKLVNVNRQTLDPGQAALVNGIVFGTRGEISYNTREIFNETGVVHILSVSGLHVGLVVAGMLALLNLLRLQRFTFPVLTVVLVIYTYITGMGPAVERSALMAWAQLLGRRLGRERDWPTTLALSAFIILVFSPRSLLNPGFQLSFAATWGILHLGPLIGGWLERIGISSPWIRGTVSVALAAQIATLPLVAYYYNTFSLISIPANLFVVPIVGLILPLGMAAAVAGLVYIKIALVINFFTAAMLDLMMIIVDYIHRIPGGVIYVPTPPLAVMAAWFAAVLVLAVFYGGLKKKILRLTAFVLLFFTPVIYMFTAGLVDVQGDLIVHVVDVGQGDSILVHFPNGRNMLVDAGGYSGEFRDGHGAGMAVASYLRRLGISSLDVLVISHPHEDHAAGVGFLLGRFNIGRVLVSPVGSCKAAAEQVDPGYLSIIARIKELKIPLQEVTAGDKIVLDPDVQVNVIFPEKDLLVGTRSDLNNNSVVISVRYGEKSFLLTGDIEKEGQARLLERGYKLKHSALKVPHHGSSYTLIEFLDRVDPEISFISVGKNNLGLPAQSILSALGGQRKQVFRTDLEGLLLFGCDGHEIYTGNP